MNTYRYQENGTEFSLQTFPKPFHTPLRSTLVLRGNVSELPQWLVPIIAVAKMSQHGIQVVFPPPDFIVWFSTSPDGVFEEFIDVTQS